MHKKFEINWTKIKGGCKSGRKVVTYNSKSDLPLVCSVCLSVIQNNSTMQLSSHSYLGSLHFKVQDSIEFYYNARMRLESCAQLLMIFNEMVQPPFLKR